MDIAVKKINEKSFIVYDNTYTMLPFTDKSIYKLDLTVYSPFIKKGKKTLDVLYYMERNRKERELYLITPDVLGINSDEFPDGIYHFEFNINNTTIIKEHVVVLYNIEKRLKDLLDYYDNNIEITNTGLVFNDYGRVEDIVKVNYVFALYYDIISKINGNTNNVVRVNDLIDKLKRVLLTC